VTDARLEDVHPDRVTAREFLAQADELFADAGADGLRTASQAILLHNASIAACDAILQAAGKRVTGGDGAHALRIDTALGVVGGDTEDLADRLDATRERRNEASYRAGVIARASVVDAREAVTELLEIARAQVA
jgi:hypothetical protein